MAGSESETAQSWNVRPLVWIGLVAFIGLAFLLFGGSQTARADDLGGNYYSDAWNPLVCPGTNNWSAGSFAHYHVNGSLTVAAGCTLIMYGVPVYFEGAADGDIMLDVFGNLTVNAGANLTDGSEGAATYYDVYYEPGSTGYLDGDSVFEYVGCPTVCFGGLVVDDADIIWRDVDIRFGGAHGVWYDLPDSILMNGVYIHDNAYAGVIFLSDGASGLDLTVIDSFIEDNGGPGFDLDGTFPGDVSFNCQGSSFSSNGGDGVTIETVEGALNVTATGCFFNGNGGSGFFLGWSKFETTVTLMDSSFDGNSDHGMDLDYAAWNFNTEPLPPFLSISIDPSSFDDNGIDGFRVGHATTDVTFNATDSTFDDNGMAAPGDGIHFENVQCHDCGADNWGNLTFTLNNVSASYNSDDGLGFVTIDGNLEVDILDSAIDDNGNFGINVGTVGSYDGGTLTLRIDPSSVAYNYLRNLYVSTVRGDADISIADTNMDGDPAEESYGIFLNELNSWDGWTEWWGNLSLTLDGVNVSDHRYDNVRINDIDGGVTVTITDSTIDNAGDQSGTGLYISTVNTDWWEGAGLWLSVDPSSISENYYAQLYVYEVHGDATILLTDSVLDGDPSESSYGVEVEWVYENWPQWGNLTIELDNTSVSHNEYENFWIRNVEGNLAIDLMDSEVTDSQDGYGFYVNCVHGWWSDFDGWCYGLGDDYAAGFQFTADPTNLSENRWGIIYMNIVYGDMLFSLTDVNGDSDPGDLWNYGVDIEYVYSHDGSGQWGNLTLELIRSSLSYYYYDNVYVYEVHGSAWITLVDATVVEADSGHGFYFDSVNYDAWETGGFWFDADPTNLSYNYYGALYLWAVYGDSEISLTDTTADGDPSEGAYGINIKNVYSNYDQWGNLTLSLLRSSVSNNYNDNVYIGTIDGSLTVDVVDSAIDNAGDGSGIGLYIETVGSDQGGVLDLNVDPSSISGNYYDQIYIWKVWGDAFLSITNSTLNGDWNEDAYGIYINWIRQMVGHDNWWGNLTFDLTGSSVSENVYSNIYVYWVEGRADFTLTDATVADSQWEWGVYVDCVNGYRPFEWWGCWYGENWDEAGFRFVADPTDLSGNYYGALEIYFVYGDALVTLTDTNASGEWDEDSYGIYVNYVYGTSMRWGNLTLALTRSEVSNNTYDNVYLNEIAGNLIVDMIDSLVSDSQWGYGIYIEYVNYWGWNGGEFRFTADPSHVDRNYYDNLYIGSVYADAWMDITDSTFDWSVDDQGIYINWIPGDGWDQWGNLTFDFVGSSASFNYYANVEFDYIDGSLWATIANSTLDNSTWGEGFYVSELNEYDYDGRELWLTVTDSSLSGNYEENVYLEYIYGDAYVTFLRSTVDWSADSYGIYVDDVDGVWPQWGNLSLTLIDSSVSWNAYTNVYLDDIYGNLILTVTDSWVVGSTWGEGVYIYGANEDAWEGGGLWFTADPSYFNDNGYSGFYLYYVYGILSIYVSDTSFSGNGWYSWGYGIYVANQWSTGSELDLSSFTFRNLTASENYNGGVYVAASDNGPAWLTMMGWAKIANNSNDDGFYLGWVNEGGLYVDVDLTGANISLNDGTGFYLDGFDDSYEGSLSASFTDSEISWNSGNGAYIFGGGCYPLGFAEVTVLTSRITANVGYGFYVECSIGADLTIDVEDSEASYNGNDGFYFGGTELPERVYWANYGLTYPNYMGTSAIYDGQYIFVFGGTGCFGGCWTNDIRRIDPVTGSQTLVADLPGSRGYTSAVFDGGSNAYIFGGTECWYGGCTTSQVVRFNTTSYSVSVAGYLPWSMWASSAVWDPVRQRAYVFGGFSDYWANCEIFEWDPANATSSVIDYLYYCLGETSAVWDPVNNVAYIFGGSPCFYCWPYSDIQMFEPGVGTSWVGGMVSGYRGTSAVWYNGRAYLFGGDYCLYYWWYCQSYTIQEWDPAWVWANSFSESMDYPVAWSSAVLVGDKAHILGGGYYGWGAFGYVMIADLSPLDYPDLSATVLRNAITGNGCYGVYMSYWNGDYAFLDIEYNDFTWNGWDDWCDGFYFGGIGGGGGFTPDSEAWFIENNASDNGGSGLWVGYLYGPTYVQATGNFTDNNLYYGMYFEYNYDGATLDGNVTLVLTNEPIRWNGYTGFYHEGMDGALRADLRGVQAIGNGWYDGGSGVYIDGSSGAGYGDLYVDASGANMSENEGDGLYYGGYYGEEDFWFDLSNGTFDWNDDDGAYVLGGGCYWVASFWMGLDGAEFWYNGDEGLYVGCVAGVDLTWTFDNWTFLGNGGYGLWLDGIEWGSFTVYVTNSNFTGNGGGVRIGDIRDLQAGMSGYILIADNVFDAQWNCCGSGIWIGEFEDGFAGGTVDILRNLVTTFSDDGIYWSGVDGCEDCWPPNTAVRDIFFNVFQNEITWNDDSGFYADDFAVTRTWITIDETDILYNDEEGVYLDEADYGGTVTVYIVRSNISENGDSGIYVDEADDEGSAWILEVVDTLLLNNGDSGDAGLYVYDSDEGPITFTLRNVTIDASYYSIYLEYADNFPITGRVYDSSLLNGVYGLYTDYNDDSYFDVLMVNTTIEGMTYVDVYLYNGAFEFVTLLNTPIRSWYIYDWGCQWEYETLPCSWILIQWFYHVQVLTGASLNQPAANVTLSLSENGMLVGGGLTGQDGMLKWRIGNERRLSIVQPETFMTTAQANNGVMTATANALIDVNQEVITIYLLGDYDADGLSDFIDPDDDNDGVVDGQDAFPYDPTEWWDTDGDGIGNNADPDDDGDGVLDASDQCPLDPSGYTDFDLDGICDSLDLDDDGDGVPDGNDDFPYDPAEWNDLDGDGIGDNADADRDGDGVDNGNDTFPDNGNEWRDTDGDGVGDNADWDDDGDGVPDVNDAFPYDANETADLDGDGVGDNADPDDDNDGVDDVDDAFPQNDMEWVDTDGDGTGDNADWDDDGDGWADSTEIESGSDPTDPLSVPADLDGDGVPDVLDDDIDGDGVANANDAFPYDAGETRDNDNDGTGDNADPDDDNDGIPDGSDPQPFVYNPAQDTDGDGVPDATDPDDDNDGTPDTSDDFPLNPNESRDTDGDGIGDNADWDDDGDGFGDSVEIEAGSDPLDPASVPPPPPVDTDRDGDGIPNADDAFPDNPNEWADNDRDGIGDNADWDDDNDGFADSVEIGAGSDPLSNASVPSENPDRDGDGIPNAADAFPDNPNEWSDFDGDGVGDNTDWDDDGDMYSDAVEAQGNSDPLNQSSTPPDIDGDFIIDALDDDRDGDGVANVNDAFPEDPSRSERADRAQVDAMSALLVPLYILVVLAVLVLLFMMLRRRRPAEAPREPEEEERPAHPAREPEEEEDAGPSPGEVAETEEIEDVEAEDSSEEDEKED